MHGFCSDMMEYFCHYIEVNNLCFWNTLSRYLHDRLWWVLWNSYNLLGQYSAFWEDSACLFFRDLIWKQAIKMQEWLKLHPSPIFLFPSLLIFKLKFFFKWCRTASKQIRLILLKHWNKLTRLAVSRMMFLSSFLLILQVCCVSNFVQIVADWRSNPAHLVFSWSQRKKVLGIQYFQHPDFIYKAPVVWVAW